MRLRRLSPPAPETSPALRRGSNQRPAKIGNGSKHPAETGQEPLPDETQDETDGERDPRRAGSQQADRQPAMVCVVDQARLVAVADEQQHDLGETGGYDIETQ